MPPLKAAEGEVIALQKTRDEIYGKWNEKHCEVDPLGWNFEEVTFSDQQIHGDRRSKHQKAGEDPGHGVIIARYSSVLKRIIKSHISDVSEELL